MKRVVVALIVAAVWPAGLEPPTPPGCRPVRRFPLRQVLRDRCAAKVLAARWHGPMRERISLIDSTNPAETPTGPPGSSRRWKRRPCNVPGQAAAGP